jgi:hypothetical protein
MEFTHTTHDLPEDDMPAGDFRTVNIMSEAYAPPLYDGQHVPMKYIRLLRDLAILAMEADLPQHATDCIIEALLIGVGNFDAATTQELFGSGDVGASIEVEPGKYLPCRSLTAASWIEKLVNDGLVKLVPSNKPSIKVIRRVLRAGPMKVRATPIVPSGTEVIAARLALTDAGYSRYLDVLHACFEMCGAPPDGLRTHIDRITNDAPPWVAPTPEVLQ